MKTDIKSLLLPELEQALAQMGEPRFRAKQIYRWLHTGARSFEEMTNLAKPLRGALAERFAITAPEILRKQVSRIDGTVKYLWRLRDGSAVESVVMHYEHGNTICISTEVGCAMGCAFCASTLGGLVRRLAPSEMLDQVLFAQLDTGERISNIVLMGIGEPLDNFDSVVQFLRLVNSDDGLHIGMRHISLSTCGLVPRIRELAALDLQLTLSVSLHAPDNETRSRIMPVNRRYDVDTLLAACRDYFDATGRRISYEYAMIDGVNDTEYHARLLAKRVKAVAAHVNLIPLNRVEERAFRPSTSGHMKAFQKILEEEGVNFTVRRRLGSDVDASCGQLRRKMQNNKQ